MNYTENHLLKIKSILESDHSLFKRLEQVGEYLIEANQLSCVSIFRCVGDELDDVIFVSSRKNVIKKVRQDNDGQEREYINALPTRIVLSKFAKQRYSINSNKIIPEFIIPIIRIRQVTGVLHAEKNEGSHFAPKEVRLLKETANLIGKLFMPRVIHLN